MQIETRIEGNHLQYVSFLALDYQDKLKLHSHELLCQYEDFVLKTHQQLFLD